MPTDEVTIAIMGQEVPAVHEQLEIGQIQFLADNPRVYAAIREMSDFDDLMPEEKQIRIYERLLQEPSVKNLVPEIKRDGGLQDPIIVRHDTGQVIEGNSRLAAYHKLKADTGDERWNLIRCLVVSTLTDEQQTRLLGQAHLLGRTEWSPYAKALFCFRWVEETKRDIATLAALVNFSVREIEKNVQVVKLMKANGDDKLSRFSYYDVLVRNKKISEAMKTSERLRNTVLAHIKADDQKFTAQQMRTWLPTVIAKPRILRKYEKGDVHLGDAFDRAKISGTEQRLKKIRDGLDDIEYDEIHRLEHHQLKAAQQVIRQIRQRLKRVTNMIDARTTSETT